MTDTVPFLDRRRMLGLLSGLPIVGRAGGAWAGMAATAAPAFPEAATILVGGPDGGTLDRWSQIVQPALARTLPLDTTVHRIIVGAADGVTAANRFDARISPDGQTTLLAPGEAVLTWIVGDPRAQYDPAQWLSVMAVIAPGLVLIRPRRLTVNRALRLATTSPAGPDLPAILGIELLGASCELVPPIAQDAELQAFNSEAIDAVFLRGSNVPIRARALITAGAVPAFTLGTLDDSGKPRRCPAFPDVPTLPERLTPLRSDQTNEALYAAWRAAAMASQLQCTLVLPVLTPAAMVALWRHAAAAAASTLDVQSAALSVGMRAIGGSEATATTSAEVPDRPALLALRQWLATRFGWRPA